MGDSTAEYDDKTPELRLIQESEEKIADATRKRKVYVGRTNSAGRARLRRTQTSESSYPFGFSIVPFENFGATDQPSAVGDAVFVIEAWEVIGVVEGGGQFQWNLNCDVQAKHKKSENNRIEGNLLEHNNYGAALEVAIIVEYYLRT